MRDAALTDLIQEYQRALPELDSNIEELHTFYREHQQDQDLSAQARLAFLMLLTQNPELLQDAKNAEFLAQAIGPADFDNLQWETPAHMLEFCDTLYGCRIAEEENAQEVRMHVRYLLQQALRRYEEEEDWEALFSLVEIAPTSPMMNDSELRRLRHLARVYELRRVRRNRFILYGYLIVQVLLVLIVFPLLFINAENGELQRRVEELANVEIGDEGYRLFTYTDGLYWAVITAGSIGYGDITPMTTTGKLIAGTLGTMGVVTVGVIAGLVLKWITPRTLD
ncbi:MAG: two pore domain potassium channel family protein [Caldilineaceae bacterium]|nr:two pore domain potassium channel family protein [Caldilineaceae bacterium]